MIRTKGGYAMIDAIGFDVSEATATVKGMFAQFATAHESNKPIVIFNAEVDGYRYSPAYTVVVPLADGSYQFTFMDGTFTVDSADLVTKAG